MLLGDVEGLLGIDCALRGGFRGVGWGGERVEKRMSKFSVHWKAIFFLIPWV